ncbi:MAG: hypothetical protein Rhims3KO_23730 [Hyphomicrobiales bacterium]
MGLSYDDSHQHKFAFVLSRRGQDNGNACPKRCGTFDKCGSGETQARRYRY